MSATTVDILIPVLLLLFLMASRLPVAFSLAISGGLGLILVGTFDTATSSLASIPYSATATYTLTLIPMFILMGLFISHAGALDYLFDVAERLTRRLPGCLGVTTVLACTFFGGISGSSVADAATLGRLAIGGMSSRGYDKAYAAAIVASAGTVAILIPPSIALVIYGILSSESIARLLLAGIVPGAMTAIAYSTLLVTRARFSRVPGFGGEATRLDARPLDDAAAAPAAAADPPTGGRIVLPALAVAAGLILSGIVVGGLYAGIFTATEAGAVAACASLGLSIAFLLTRRRFEPGVRVLPPLMRALKEAASLTSMIFALVIGATIFTQFLTVAGVPSDISNWILGFDIPPELVVALFLLMLIPLGMLIDGMSMLLIVTPLAYPVISQLGFDGIWFGILMIKMIEIGLLTPPVGLNVFVVSGMFDDLRVEDVFKRIGPFIAVELALVALLFLVPEIVTFLPDLASPKEGP